MKTFIEWLEAIQLPGKGSEDPADILNDPEEYRNQLQRKLEKERWEEYRRGFANYARATDEQLHSMMQNAEETYTKYSLRNGWEAERLANEARKTWHGCHEELQRRAAEKVGKSFPPRPGTI